MNQREAYGMTRIVEMLQNGPGNGWDEFLRDERQGEDDLRLWLKTWILPTLETISARYTKKKLGL